MGMYTEFVMSCKLKKDTPENVIKIIKYMCSCNSYGEEYLELPYHPLFGDTRWRYMLTCGSCYFVGKPHSELYYNEFSRRKELVIRCNFKNYDDEINLFVDWLSEYIEADNGEFLGYSRYEEDVVPKLIYLSK